MQHRDEVLDVSFPSRHEPAEVVKPGKEPFDLPAAFHPADTAAILSGMAAATAMRRDHLDAVVRHQHPVQAIAIVAAVANQARREVRKEAGVERGGDEVRLIR